jgi:TetR/AcrR family transcriptional repressor of nem operon
VPPAPLPDRPDTRTRLVEAARHLFWEKGYAATGLSEILARAEANSGSFYHFFESKDALLRTVLDTYAGLLDVPVRAPARARAHGPLDEVFAVLAGYRARLVDTDCTYGCPIGRLALEIDPENTPAHGLIARNFDGWTTAVADMLRRAGVPDPDEAAVFVLTVMEGAVMQARAHRSLAPYDACVRQLRLHLHALAAAPLRRGRGRARRPARR